MILLLIILYIFFLGYITKKNSFYASLHTGPTSQVQVSQTDDLQDKILTNSLITEWQ